MLLYGSEEDFTLDLFSGDLFRNRDVVYRYVDAQLRNRMELLRLNVQHQTLDRQQRSATTVIDRNRRNFVAEMANVSRTTISDLNDHTPPTTGRTSHRTNLSREISDLTDASPTSGRRRRRRTPTARGSAGSRRNLNLYGKGDLRLSVTPGLAALGLYERDVDRRGIRSTAVSGGVSRTGIGVGSGLAASSNTEYRRYWILPETGRSTTNSSNITTARVCQSAARRPTTAWQDIRIKRSPTFTGVSGTNVIPPDRALEILRTTSETDSATAAAENHQETSPENERSSADVDGMAAEDRRESRWRRDLKREAPPALYGYRQTLNFHAVMSQAERRRRLAALQTRQMAPFHSSQSHKQTN